MVCDFRTEAAFTISRASEPLLRSAVLCNMSLNLGSLLFKGAYILNNEKQGKHFKENSCRVHYCDAHSLSPFAYVRM
jgi:hypothetical protein